jgi:hypothetical protein
MADKKISEMDLVTQFKVTMYIPIVDEDEPLAEDRNKRITLAQLFGKSTTFTGTTYEFGDGDEFGPWLFIFKGSSNSVFTLPPGSADILNMPIAFCNLGTADLSVDGDGGDGINGSDPFLIAETDTKLYIFKWLGSDGWAVN